MSALITVGAIVGYLIVGAIFARVLYRRGWIDEPHEPLLAVAGWLVFLPFVALIAIGLGLHKLITRPTKPERIRAKIERLEAELGLDREK